MDVNVTTCGLKDEQVGIFSNLYFSFTVAFIFINMIFHRGVVHSSRCNYLQNI
jgi:hypothetical protein